MYHREGCPKYWRRDGWMIMCTCKTATTETGLKVKTIFIIGASSTFEGGITSEWCISFKVCFPLNEGNLSKSKKPYKKKLVF